ncbi:asparagine synthase (glutamine-hydrolyzing) [Congregibacter brevis]|uniref:asparagine synthase (glutamine-hydrolyzing) n=1 Tax=Congregibacter brevis TaxID=3081201 RepID=A0ABZ0IFI2_9GAMM|nr:asparagine synthase (glutamine-hydrolyzing) [Congregibacter sp. IMCC45268]
MCGIAGFTQIHKPIGDEQLLLRMGEAIRHRGPDAHDSYLDSGVGLHHRRLSIIDLSKAGTQPMHSTCGRYVIVFNGEIYNFIELRQSLENEGHVFQTHTDTEVILALYAKKGRECLGDLNGMFAFAIWDKQTQSLFLARDRIGKKPLYYTFINGDIAFASELKALLAADLVKRTVRLDALYDFFAYQYVPDPKCIFEGVYKLEPGYWLELNAKGHQKQQYWDVSFTQTAIGEDNARGKLKCHIDNATKRRMIADVPLGAFLSGGVDSSGIVATMARQSSKPVTTCSIGFDEERFNETEFALSVARQYETDHHEHTVRDTVAENLEEIVGYFDEPFADPSLVPTYFVSKLARQHVTVALAGDGGDEIFAGYEKYTIDAIENKWRERTPRWLRVRLFPYISKALQHSSVNFLRRTSTFLDALTKDSALAFYQTNAQITDDQWRRISSDSTREQLGIYHPSKLTIDAYTNCDGADHLSRILYTDIKTYLSGDILVKVDRMSMAHSLEVRAPLLDYTLVEFAGSLPSDLKLCNGEKKYLLKSAFRSGLPDDILTRKKMGFSPPVAEWLRDDLKGLAEKALFETNAGLLRFMEIESIKKIWDEHQSAKKDHASLLWSLLMFQLWWNKYMQQT